MTAKTNPGQVADQNRLIDEFIRLSDYNFEKLPMLDIIGDRFVENISVALPDLTQVICEASLLQLEYVPLAQIIDTLPEPAMIAICQSGAQDGEFMLIYDSTLLLTFMELLLGGSVKAGAKHTSRRFTGIEKRFGEQLTEVLLSELQASMSVIGDFEYTLEGMASDPEAANIAPQASLCVRLKLSVAMAGQTGSLEIVMPYDSLEPIRHKLAKVHYGDSGHADHVWQDFLSEQLNKTTANLEVVISRFTFSLEEMMSWSRGDVIEICTDESSPVTVTCEQTPMFMATTGHRNNGKIAVKITEILETAKG